MDIKEVLSQYRPDLKDYEELYRHLHRHPELSYQERETSRLIAQRLLNIGPNAYQIKSEIGGFGLVGLFANGDGPVVMLRADMDALPVYEKTDLGYASRVLGQDHEGTTQPVMHACGHDMHMASLLACAETMFHARSHWSGTLVVLFQPAEEKGTGAQHMVDDGLYDPGRHAIPLPDIVFAGHVTSHRSGFVGTRAGLMAGAARNFSVTLHGRGAHASQPDKSVDPVVMAAYATTRLQTLVSREINPQELSALSVSSIQAGEVENIIPQDAHMKIDLRSSSNATMTRLEQGMRRIITAETQASAAPSLPIFQTTRNFPVTWNAEDECTRVFDTFSDYFGNAFSSSIEPIGMSEDFSILATSINRPSVMWIYGGTEEAYYDRMVQEGKSEQIPSNHSAYFAPVVQPTLQRAVDCYALCALSRMARSSL